MGKVRFWGGDLDGDKDGLMGIDANKWE
jgi:hypothetical protein